MFVVLMVWIAVALVLGVLIGKAIHRADVVQFPDRAEQAWWTVAPPHGGHDDAAARSADTSESPALAA